MTTDTKPQPTDHAGRVAAVAEWILAGMRPSQIPAQAAKVAWETRPGELPKLVADAQALILADGEVEPELERAKGIVRLNMLIARSIGIQDFKGAASIQSQLDKSIAAANNPLLSPEPHDEPPRPKTPKQSKARRP